MGCRPAPAVSKALKEATQRWPQRDRASDGACADARHKALKSDHNADAEGFATAFDVDHDPDGGFDATFWAEQIRERRDPRVKYVIYRGRMFSSYSTPSRKAWEWGAYTGSNAHLKHMHVSVLPERKYDDHDWWTTEDDMPLSPDDIEKVADAVVARLAVQTLDPKDPANEVRRLQTEAVGWKLVEYHERLAKPAFAEVVEGARTIRDSLKNWLAKELGALRGSVDSLKK